MLYTRWQLCHELGINKSTFWLYEKKGLVPAPSVLVGKRLFYNEAEREAVVAFWSAWQPWKYGNMKTNEKEIEK